MKRALIAAMFMLVLSACAGHRYHAVEEAGGGQYYIGETPASIVHYPAAHAPLFFYGVSPWWGYSYYSPYFYPYYFSVSYSPWPYYASWPYHAYWPAARPYGYPPYRRHRYHYPGYYPGHNPGDETAGLPSPGNYRPPSTVPNADRLRMLDDRNLQRELRRSGRFAPSGSIRSHAPDSRSYGSPSAPTAVTRSSSRSGEGAGTVSRRNPRRHDQ